MSYQYWSVQQRSFEQGFHIPESYEFHKAEITIAQAVAGIEIAKVVVDVEMAASALMNVLEEPLQTPSRYQRMMLEDEETAQSLVVSSGPARSPSRANVCPCFPLLLVSPTFTEVRYSTPGQLWTLCWSLAQWMLTRPIYESSLLV